MNIDFISINEIFFLILLVITLLIPFKLLNQKNRLSFGHPLIFYSMIMIYYTVLSPILQIVFNVTSSRGFDFRDQYILGWKGGLLSAISVLIGYSLKAKVKKKVTKFCGLNYESLWNIGLVLNIIGLLFFMFSNSLFDSSLAEVNFAITSPL